MYNAVQQLAAIPEYNSEFKIAERLNIPIKKMRDILSFLISAGLCVERNGELETGPARIHLASDSPWIRQHHCNWRTRALENLYQEDQSKIYYSSPVTLSKADYEKIRRKLITMIEEIGKLVDPLPSEELVCLNIDWFKV